MALAPSYPFQLTSGVYQMPFGLQHLHVALDRPPRNLQPRRPILLGQDPALFQRLLGQPQNSTPAQGFPILASQVFVILYSLVFC